MVCYGRGGVGDGGGERVCRGRRRRCGGGEYARQCRRRKQQIHVCQALPKLGRAIAQIRRRRRNVPSIKHDTIIHKPCSLVDIDSFAYEGDNPVWSMSLAPFLLDYPAHLFPISNQMTYHDSISTKILSGDHVVLHGVTNATSQPICLVCMT